MEVALRIMAHTVIFLSLSLFLGQPTVAASLSLSLSGGPLSLSLSLAVHSLSLSLSPCLSTVKQGTAKIHDAVSIASQCTTESDINSEVHRRRKNLESLQELEIEQ